MRHILVISQYFYPEEFRINELCSEWVKRGYKVTVVTGIPNYPQGQFFEHYGLFKRRRETYKGVNVIRLPIVPRGKGKIQLVLNYLSFVVSGWMWKNFTRAKADSVFIFEVSPMTQALVGVWYAKKRKISCYLYVQDLWPDNVEVVTGIHHPLVIRPIDKMVQYIYKKCSHIFVTSPSFAETLKKRGVSREKVDYWPQYAEEFYAASNESARKDLSETAFTIVFTGNIGYAQGLDVLPKTAELLKNEKVRFLIVGDGRYREAFYAEVQKRNVSDAFVMTGRKKPEEVPKYLASAHVAFISFMKEPLFEQTIPAKLQSYMAFGMPILAAASGETKRIIEEAKCGVCTPIGDAERLAEQIKELMRCSDLEEMGNNAREYSKAYFNKNVLLDQMDTYLKGDA